MFMSHVLKNSEVFGEMAMAVVFTCLDALRDKVCFYFETVASCPGTHYVSLPHFHMLRP